MDAALPRSKSNFNRTVGHDTRLPLFSCKCIFLLDQRGMNTRVLLGSVHVLYKMDVFNLLCPRSSNHVVFFRPCPGLLFHSLMENGQWRAQTATYKLEGAGEKTQDQQVEVGISLIAHPHPSRAILVQTPPYCCC